MSCGKSAAKNVTANGLAVEVMKPAELVREHTLDFICRPKPVGSAPISADLVPLIERTFRFTHIIATEMRDEMIDNGQSEELEHLI